MNHLPKILKNNSHNYGPYTRDEARHLLTTLSRTCEDFKHASSEHINTIVSWLALNYKISFSFNLIYLGTDEPFHGQIVQPDLPNGTKLLNSLISKPLLKRKR